MSLAYLLPSKQFSHESALFEFNVGVSPNINQLQNRALTSSNWNVEWYTVGSRKCCHRGEPITVSVCHAHRTPWPRCRGLTLSWRVGWAHRREEGRLLQWQLSSEFYLTTSAQEDIWWLIHWFVHWPIPLVCLMSVVCFGISLGFRNATPHFYSKISVRIL